MNMKLTPEKLLLTNDQILKIEERILEEDSLGQKIINMNENVENKIFISAGIISTYKINCNKMQKPLRMTFYGIPRLINKHYSYKEVKAYFSSKSKNPNQHICDEKITPVFPRRSYSIYLGEKQIKKFNNEFIYMSLESFIDLSCIIIFTFGYGKVIRKSNSVEVYDNSVYDIKSLGKFSSISKFIKFYRENEAEKNNLFERVKKIQIKRQQNFKQSTKSKESIFNSISVKTISNENIRNSLLMKKRNNLNRAKVAKKRKDELISNKITTKTILLHKKELIKLEKEVIYLHNTEKLIRIRVDQQWVFLIQYINYLNKIFLFLLKKRRKQIKKLKREYSCKKIASFFIKSIRSFGRDLRYKKIVQTKIFFLAKFSIQQQSIKQKSALLISNLVLMYNHKIGMLNHFIDFINKIIKIQEFCKKYLKNYKLKLERNYIKATKEMINLQVKYSKSKSKKLQKISCLIPNIDTNQLKNEIKKFFLFQKYEFKKTLRRMKESGSLEKLKNDKKRPLLLTMNNNLKADYEAELKIKYPILLRSIPINKIQEIIEQLLEKQEQYSKLK